jgi:DNA-binding NarL/FixJ family response regulator
MEWARGPGLSVEGAVTNASPSRHHIDGCTGTGASDFSHGAATDINLQMPIRDGYSTTQAIRTQFQDIPDVQNVPIVAMTASAIQGDREKCQKAGMDDYLAKPVKGKLLEKMREYSPFLICLSMLKF